MFVGIVQTVALNYNNFFDQHLHITVASDAFPLLIVVAVMLIRGSSLPMRGHMSERLPAVGSGRVRWACRAADLLRSASCSSSRCSRAACCPRSR